ncbi:hypothetical protein EV356DRAFT_326487 [Viridothelium virens]|uniref:Uncharacterized protein n=1 Tax=Viridothelium virens TaxID=1048519 RepID=A0A6A6GY21_VIRVR|nr:hypothetical protein EV356DRAFT_326487 [Viridothelium virens]
MMLIFLLVLLEATNGRSRRCNASPLWIFECPIAERLTSRYVEIKPDEILDSQEGVRSVQASADGPENFRASNSYQGVSSFTHCKSGSSGRHSMMTLASSTYSHSSGQARITYQGCEDWRFQILSPMTLKYFIQLRFESKLLFGQNKGSLLDLYFFFSS